MEKITVVRYVDDNQYITEEVIKGNIDFGGRVKKQDINIYPNEGKYVPHVHIEAGGSVNNFSCCVMLDKAEYFVHGKHKDKLTNKQAKILNEVMKSPYDDKFSIWEICVLFWERNSMNKVKVSQQPDYSKLNK